MREYVKEDSKFYGNKPFTMREIVLNKLEAGPYKGGELETMRQEIDNLQRFILMIIELMDDNKKDSIAKELGFIPKG